jgi:hypothetical protein
VKLKQPAIDDIAAIEELREAIAAVAGTPSDGSPVVPNGWTTRHAARLARPRPRLGDAGPGGELMSRARSSLRRAGGGLRQAVRREGR